MNIFVYGDESGVFDKAHNAFFTYGGLIFLDKKARDDAGRRFLAAERAILPHYQATQGCEELKACKISPKHKAGLFRSTNNEIRYAAIIHQNKVHNEIYSNKKTKQRHLDYVFKVGIKKCFGRMIQQGRIIPNEVENIYFRLDEHTTATDGRYELREGIEEELKSGTINHRYGTFHPPIFKGMTGGIHLDFKDSTSDPLIRASDIIANKALYHARTDTLEKLKTKVYTTEFPL